MLGRKNYTGEEIDHGRSAIDQQLGVYKKLAGTISGRTADVKAEAVLEEFEGLFFNNMALVLDRYFVRRLRTVTGKDGNALNEVELICDSLMNNDGVLQASNVIKYVPDQSVVKLNMGDQISLTAEKFERLSAAFFEELESRFLSSGVSVTA